MRTLLCLLFVLCLSPVLAQEPPQITRIIVEGNEAFSLATILELSGHNIGSPYTQETLDAIRANLFKTGCFGYLATPDAIHVIGKQQGKEYIVAITVKENERVESVQISGAEPLAENIVRKLITKTPVYNPLQLERDAIAIQEFYRKRGYLAVVLPEDNFDPTSGELRVPIQVARVGKIVFKGNQKLSSEQLTRLLKTKPGEYLSFQKITKLDLPALRKQKGIRKANYELFESARGQVEVIFRIEEQSTPSPPATP